MNYRKRLKFIILVISLLVLAVNNLYAGTLENIPLPAGSEKQKEETRRIGGSDFRFAYFVNSADAQSIKDFYRQRLPELGWRQSQPLKEIEQIPGLQIDPNLTQLLAQNLVFEKEDLLLTINFLPAGFSADKKTRFTISVGKAELETELPEGRDFTPELLAQPKKDVAPVYPGASLVNLSEGAKAFRASYFAADDLESVALFYKTKMPNYGWHLAKEPASEKLTAGLPEGYDIAKYLPPAEGAAQVPEPGQMEFLQLVFSNAQGDRCNIGISELVSSAGLEAEGNFTIIVVDYAQKK